MGKFDKLSKASPALAKKEEVARVKIALDAQTSGSVFRKLPVNDIITNPDNDYSSHDTDESIRIFAEDIERNGLLHNVVVNRDIDSGEYILISGERRIRAIRLLQADTSKNADGKWDEVPAKVYSGLSRRQSMIMLDAANLQTRGGISDEKQLRKGLNRYVDNLKEEYHISEAAAMEIAKEITDASAKTIQVNRKIEQETLPEFRELIDNGILSKKWSVAFLNFNEEEQRMVVKALTTVIGYSQDERVSSKENSKITQLLLLGAEKERGDARNFALQSAVDVAENDMKNSVEKNALSGGKKAVRNTRDEYIQKVDELRAKTRRMNTKKRIEAMAGFDELAGESDEKIVDKLAEAISEISALHHTLISLMQIDKILTSGVNEDGSPMSDADKIAAKHKRKEILNRSE